MPIKTWVPGFASDSRSFTTGKNILDQALENI